jgi:hypothetical protein
MDPVSQDLERRIEEAFTAQMKCVALWDVGNITYATMCEYLRAALAQHLERAYEAGVMTGMEVPDDPDEEEFEVDFLDEEDDDGSA